MRTQYIPAVADEEHTANGVAVVGSFQTIPQTSKPYKVRGVSHSDSGKTVRHVEIRLSQDEARKLVQDWVSFGLFGRHGRIETHA